MTTEDLKALPLLQTSIIAEACKDPATLDYILSCLARFFPAIMAKHAPRMQNITIVTLRAVPGTFLRDTKRPRN